MCEGDQAVEEDEGVDEGTAASGEVPEVDDDDSGYASNRPDDVTDDDGDEECRKGC